MLIMSRVCVEFHNKRGETIFAVTPKNRLSFIDAPEAIQEDPMFQMLVDDGSLEASLTPARKKKLEQDPEDGTTAAGRRSEPVRDQEEAQVLKEEKEHVAETKSVKKPTKKKAEEDLNSTMASIEAELNEDENVDSE